MPLTSTPNATDRIKDTQSPIKDNFDLINAGFPINHIDFGIANAGWHKDVTFPDTIATASPALASTDQIALLPFEGITSGVAELAVQKFGDDPIAFTEGKIDTAGFSRWASGLFFQYGSASYDFDNTVKTLNFNVLGIPAFTSAPVAIFTSIGNNAGPGPAVDKNVRLTLAPQNTWTATSATFFAAGGVTGVKVYFIALGI